MNSRTLQLAEVYSIIGYTGIFKLQLHGAIYRPDSFVLMLRYCANLKAIRYESTSFNRIVADKSHRVIAALGKIIQLSFILEALGYNYTMRLTGCDSVQTFVH